jgi:NADPH:quinone reductase-like Zn-dependent oxidoreductase
MTTMRAAIHTRYGPPEVQSIERVEAPNPAADEVLVRVRATTVNRTDTAALVPEPQFARVFTGLVRPRRHILGSEFAGEVLAVGGEVREFSVGDHVFGVNATRLGAHAELMSIREQDPIAHKPPQLSFEEAAAVCDGATLAGTCLRWAGLREGQRILVYGASGSIGTAGVQLARDIGAHVTAVCGADGLDAVGSLHPDRLLDRLETDFTAEGGTYDVVLDAVGKLRFRDCAGTVVGGGKFVTTELGPRLEVLPQAIWTKFVGSKQILMPIPRYSKRWVLRFKELVEDGRYRPVIDRTYPLDQIVEASRYVASGQKIGNVVITVA